MASFSPRLCAFAVWWLLFPSNSVPLMVSKSGNFLKRESGQFSTGYRRPVWANLISIQISSNRKCSGRATSHFHNCCGSQNQMIGLY